MFMCSRGQPRTARVVWPPRISPERLFVTTSSDEAIALIQRAIHANDMVLVKGSRALGMDRIVPAISRDDVVHQSLHHH